MSTLHRYVLSDGTQVAIEADDMARGGGPVAAPNRIQDAGRTIVEALSGLPALIRDVRNIALSEVPLPSEIQIEFGAKISGEVGLIVAKSQAEANFKISVKWKPTTAD